MADWEDVDFVWQVGGEADIVVVVDAADTRRLNEIISRAREMEEVNDTKSRLILDERLG
jgi:DNA-binding Lrp family transcriptional regulator